MRAGLTLTTATGAFAVNRWGVTSPGAQSMSPPTCDGSTMAGDTVALVSISIFSSFGMTSVPSSSMVSHDRLVGEVAELHVADQLVDAELVVLDHLLEALVGVADDDHVGVAELVGVELTLLLRVRRGNIRSLSSCAEVRELPLEGELGDVLVPPPHRVPDAVRLALRPSSRRSARGCRPPPCWWSPG